MLRAIQARQAGGHTPPVEAVTTVRTSRTARRLLAVALAVAALGAGAGTHRSAKAAGGAGACPWLTSTAPADIKAGMVLAPMTLDENIGLVHGLTAPAPSIGPVPGPPPYG